MNIQNKKTKAFKDLEWIVRISEENHQTENSGPKWVKTYTWRAFSYEGAGDTFDAHISGIMELRSPCFYELLDDAKKDWQIIANLNGISKFKIQYQNFNVEDLIEHIN